MPRHRKVLCTTYATAIAAWMGAGPWCIGPADACRLLTQAERAALRGGKPGICNPQTGGKCDSDPLQPGGCSQDNGKCDDNSCQGLLKNANCAPQLPLINGQDPPQCQPGGGNGACAQVNDPMTDCYDTYNGCKCSDDNGDCQGTAVTTWTGTCVNSSPKQ